MIGTRAIGVTALGGMLLMMGSGALVAGTHAGHIYNTWPDMGGTWLPQQLFALQPYWYNFLQNPITIQFTHRWLAILLLVAVSVFALRLWHNARRLIGCALLLGVVGQITLGIATLVHGVPLLLGVGHQASAMLLLTLLAIGLFPRYGRVGKIP